MNSKQKVVRPVAKKVVRKVANKKVNSAVRKPNVRKPVAKKVNSSAKRTATSHSVKSGIQKPPLASFVDRTVQKEFRLSAKEKKVPGKKNVALLVLLSIVTLGIYPAIWYLKRKPEFDNLGTQKKLGKGLAVFYLALTIVSLIASVVFNFFPKFMDNIYSLIGSSVFSLIVLVVYIVLAFNVRGIINQAWAAKGVQRKVSWFFTLIFNFLYLQYEINRTVDDTEMNKRVGPWVCFAVAVLLLIIIGILAWLFLMSVIVGVLGGLGT